VQTVAYEIMRELRRVRGNIEGDLITVSCSPKVASFIENNERDYLDNLEKRFHKKIDIKASQAVAPDEYKVIGGQPPPARKRGGGRKRKKNGAAEARSGA